VLLANRLTALRERKDTDRTLIQ